MPNILRAGAVETCSRPFARLADIGIQEGWRGSRRSIREIEMTEGARISQETKYGISEGRRFLPALSVGFVVVIPRLCDHAGAVEAVGANRIVVVEGVTRFGRNVGINVSDVGLL